MMPVILLNSLPRAAFTALPNFLLSDALGAAIFSFGFLFEIIADRQKDAWVKEKREKKHSEEFLTRGLWSKSRHPNYFGEITLWTGLAVLAGGVLLKNPAQVGLGLSGNLVGKLGTAAGCAVSPAFVAFLLLKVKLSPLTPSAIDFTDMKQVSGVPLSENKYDKKYGDRKDYQEWKKNTPMLIPKF
jgi:steroid 5-alpha reductase family enzyme